QLDHHVHPGVARQRQRIVAPAQARQVDAAVAPAVARRHRTDDDRPAAALGQEVAMLLQQPHRPGTDGAETGYRDAPRRLHVRMSNAEALALRTDIDLDAPVGGDAVRLRLV